MTAGITIIAPNVPKTVPPAVASAIAPNRFVTDVPTASGTRLASDVTVTSMITPDRLTAARTTSVADSDRDAIAS